LGKHLSIQDLLFGIELVRPCQVRDIARVNDKVGLLRKCTRRRGARQLSMATGKKRHSSEFPCESEVGNRVPFARACATAA
jgi:hypothetical protein